MTESELEEYSDICFEIRYDSEEIEIECGDNSVAELTGMTFVRVPQAKVERRARTDGKIAGEGA